MSLFGAFAFLRGFYRVECDARDSRKLINALMRRGVEHGELRRTERGGVSFKIARKDWSELREIIDKCGILVYSVYGEGLPFFVHRYRRRAGMIAGFVCFMLIVWMSTLFVWRVEVVSDTEMNKTAILHNLKDIGVVEGMFIPGTDFWAKSTEYLTTFDDCSWMSVNMVGTTAMIEVRPMLRGGEEDAGTEPCNIIAGKGGVVDSFVVHSGKSYVAAGDIVKEGDLLVSGIIEDIQGDFRLLCATAEVYAEVERTLTVTVPLAHSERVYTGRERSRSSFFFFGAEFEVPFGDRDPGQGWEVESESERLLLPDATPLPMGKSRQIWREYTEIEEYYTAEEAKVIAELRLDRMIAAELPGAEILGVMRQYTEDEASVTITARIRCICDIAEKKEIKINNGGGA